MIIVYITSITSNLELSKKQKQIQDILDGKKIEYETRDVASSAEDKNKMREGCGNPTALPPQIFNGDQYLGDADAFEEAVENEDLKSFLLLK